MKQTLILAALLAWLAVPALAQPASPTTAALGEMVVDGQQREAALRVRAITAEQRAAVAEARAADAEKRVAAGGGKAAAPAGATAETHVP